MKEIITELITPHIKENNDGTFIIDDKIYENPEFRTKLEDKSTDDRYVSYCIVCNFVSRNPARGMLFNTKKELIDYFIANLVSQETDINGYSYIYVFIFIIFIIFVSIIVGYIINGLVNS